MVGIGILGVLGFIVFLIMGIISLFRKNGKAKRLFLISISSFIVFLVAALNTDTETSPTPKAVTASNDSADQKDNGQEKSKEPAKQAEEKPKTPKQIAEEVAAEEFSEVKQVAFNAETGNLFIKATGKENFTNNMTRDGLKLAILEVVETVSPSPEVKNVDFNILFPLVDQYGNVSDGSVMKVMLSRETIDKINFKNFNIDNLDAIADGYWLHPGFK